MEQTQHKTQNKLTENVDTCHEFRLKNSLSQPVQRPGCPASTCLREGLQFQKLTWNKTFWQTETLKGCSPSCFLSVEEAEEVPVSEDAVGTGEDDGAEETVNAEGAVCVRTEAKLKWQWRQPFHNATGYCKNWCRCGFSHTGVWPRLQRVYGFNAEETLGKGCYFRELVFSHLGGEEPSMMQSHLCELVFNGLRKAEKIGSSPSAAGRTNIQAVIQKSVTQRQTGYKHVELLDSDFGFQDPEQKKGIRMQVFDPREVLSSWGEQCKFIFVTNIAR